MIICNLEMQFNPIRIGTRESQLAVWQATLVKDLLEQNGQDAELIFIKSEGDIDLVTPLYAMGVQGVFTRSLDAALLNDKIDIAVHSMKDVPVQLPQGLVQTAVLSRASHKDILVFNSSLANENVQKLKDGQNLTAIPHSSTSLTIATSSIRRKAQWLHRFPDTAIENLRGNVNTRLRKVAESNWDGAIFAAAGLERIQVRPENGIDLDWMLPAPAQGAIMVVSRQNDNRALEACVPLNDESTAICVKIERDFLSGLMGGCSTPISALASMVDDKVFFRGNIVSPDGKESVEVEQLFLLDSIPSAGAKAAQMILEKGGDRIIEKLKHA
ncbi:MAG TPA: hydroxymethylbilane synthase [Niabella sp.]|nr:hydroxymethylbilane synthase [Niabella sp.]HOZ98037.1 hydroxymethylbilane synthase [Niabella sp.]HQW14818.1 hydroxymethylbilane synthase [Niabella sp.]HQX18557.1 hydroxymethylbilane synthase [Niabella sp.]HQX40777.1 hydroxymethylbilane synthase [Niabella sp.]